jgi:hypothetical protein
VVSGEQRDTEQALNKAIKQCFKSINVRQAFAPFINIQADQRAQNSRKMAQKLMKEFSIAYKDQMKDASTHQIVKILDMYASHGWLIADTYNSIIKALGNRFDSFSFGELANVCQSFGKIGLRHQDVI